MHLSRKEGTAIKVAPSSSLCAAGMKRRFLASILCLASPNSIGTHSFPKTSPSARLASNFSMENRGDQRRQIGQAGVFSPHFALLCTTFHHFENIIHDIFQICNSFSKKFCDFFHFFCQKFPFPTISDSEIHAYLQIFRFIAQDSLFL